MSNLIDRLLCFVEELSFVLVALFLLLIVIVGIRRVPKSSGGFSVKGTLALLVLVLLPAVCGWRFVRHVHIVAELRVKLRSGEEEHLVLQATYTSPAR
ncbi:MAG TPA: hypothetical protein VFN20_14925 [Candidatus Acidoferrum sp.]|nr:hypothetical protein [Candidatus Acidoferrum sp.]